MFLIIPTIPIRHGHCGASIARIHSGEALAIYSPDPGDRARLLRKENAKAVHLEFLDCQPWEEESLITIRKVREVVDIPIEIALTKLPDELSSLGTIFDAGANRLFAPSNITDSVCHELNAQFGRKIVSTFTLDALPKERFESLHAKRIDRIAIELSSHDDLLSGIVNRRSELNWQLLEHAALAAKDAGIHITAMHGVGGYPDLHRIQSLAPAIDSLVLCRALNENRFPCQLIWRELEEEFAIQTGTYANLWTNPLEGKPHI